MPHQEDIRLMAHLMRRAGFGDPREELEERVSKGYEAVVEELLYPERQPAIDEELLYRFFPGYEGAGAPPINQADWVFRMINTKRPLEEKMALFWHQLFATSNSKVDNPPELTRQIAIFREHGLGTYRDLLVEVAKSPAMIFWLDNHGNHDGAINENWGRELLELFSLGVGNYSEDDIREAARAFTGWTIAPKIPRNPYGRFHWQFEYKPEDHDNLEKTFLGIPGTSTAKTSWTLLWISRLRPGSWPATSIDSSLPTSLMSPLGALHHQLILKPSSCWWMPTMNPVATSALFYEYCSTQSSSRMHASPG